MAGLKAGRRALEAPLLRLALEVVPRLPRRVVLALARGGGAAAYLFSKRTRRLGLTNLDVAFGDQKTPAEKRRILRESLRNLALVLLDLLWFSRDSEARMARWFVAAPNLEAALTVPGARVGVTGHFGNWELVGRYWALRTGKMMSVARPLKNLAVDQLIQRAREDNNQQVIPRAGALRKLAQFLRAGGTVGLLLDQNTKPAEGGIFVDFFGRPVAVSPAAGVLTILTHAQILFAYARPQSDGTYVGELPHMIAPAEVAGLPRKTAAAELTQRITAFYEEAIRAYPECWLWSYKRWRYIPAGMDAADFPDYARPVPPP